MRAVAPMPRLQVRIHQLPQEALYGEVMQCMLEVTNVGTQPASSLRMAPSHPAFFGLGVAGSLSSRKAEYPQGLFEDAGQHGLTCMERAWADTAYDPEAELDPAVVQLPLGEDGKGLAAGDVTMIPLWCRASRPGVHVFRLLFSYTPMADAGAVMRYRLCQVQQTLHVLPSLRAAVHLRTSAADMNKLTLAVHVDNATSPSAAPTSTDGTDAEAEQLEVVQLSFLSQQWILTPSAVASMVRPARLSAGNKAVIYMQMGPAALHESESGGAAATGHTGPDAASCVSSLALSADAGSTARRVLALPASPLAEFVRGWEKRGQGIAYWNEQAGADASAGSDIGAGKSSKKQLADARRAKLEAWQKQHGGSADAGSRVVIVWTCDNRSRMGFVVLRFDT